MNALTNKSLPRYVAAGSARLLPWEPLLPYFHLPEYCRLTGLTVKAMLARHGVALSEEQFLSPRVDALMRRLLTDFVNAHDRGLDGKGLPNGAGFPVARVPVADLVWLGETDALRDHDGVRELLRRVAELTTCRQDCPLDELARFIAWFYRHLHGLASPPVIANASITSPPMSGGLPEPVAQALDQCARAMTPFLDACWLMGSHASEDAAAGSSDLDILAMVSSTTCGSPEALLTLRQLMLNLWPALLRCDRLQHHGLLLIPAAETGRYPESAMPLNVLRGAKLLFGQPRHTFELVDSSFDARSALCNVASYLRGRAGERTDSFTAFQLKWDVGLVALLPALLDQALGQDTGKADAIARWRRDRSCETALARASLAREQGLLSLPDGPDCHARPDNLSEYARAATSTPAPRPLLDALGDAWHAEVADMADEALQSLMGFLEPVHDRRDHVTWNDWPADIDRQRYEDAFAALQASLAERHPDAVLHRFGSISYPGISDLDTFVVAPDDSADLSGLNDLFSDEWARKYGWQDVLAHPPSFLVPQSLLPTLAKLYPVSGMDSPDLQRPGWDDIILQMSELAMRFFLRNTLLPLRLVPRSVRHVLMHTWGMRHSLRVLRDILPDLPSLRDYAENAESLRQKWRSRTCCENLKDADALLRQALNCQLLVIEALRGELLKLLGAPPVGSAQAPAEAVGMLGHDTLFISGWTPERCVELSLQGIEHGISLFVFPSEFMAIPLAYGKAAAPLGACLDDQLLVLDKSLSFPACDPLRRRADTINQLLDFLLKRNFTAADLPHWRFLSERPRQTSDAQWWRCRARRSFLPGVPLPEALRTFPANPAQEAGEVVRQNSRDQVYDALNQAAELVAPERRSVFWQAAVSTLNGETEFANAFLNARIMRLETHLFNQVFKTIAASGAKVIGIYGAGQHTRRLLAATDRLAGFERVMIFDDDETKRGTEIAGVKVFPTSSIPPMGVQALLVSSDTYEDAMLGKLQTLTSLPLFTIYS